MATAYVQLFSISPFLSLTLPLRRSVFVNTVLIQWAFKIKSDPSSPIDELAFTESANTHPMPFKVIFEPRVTKTLEGVRDLMEDYGAWRFGYFEDGDFEGEGIFGWIFVRVYASHGSAHASYYFICSICIISVTYIAHSIQKFFNATSEIQRWIRGFILSEASGGFLYDLIIATPSTSLYTRICWCHSYDMSTTKDIVPVRTYT